MAFMCSQAARVVVDAIQRYMSECYVQLGAGYGLSTTASLTVESAHDVVHVSAPYLTCCNEVGIGED